MIKNSSKIKYCAPTFWKKIFLFQKNKLFKVSENFFYNRASIIPLSYIGSKIFIYTGKKWHKRIISRWMVGFKIGEFTWNRKPALYKAKQLRKKNKKQKAKMK